MRIIFQCSVFFFLFVLFCCSGFLKKKYEKNYSDNSRQCKILLYNLRRVHFISIFMCIFVYRTVERYYIAKTNKQIYNTRWNMCHVFLKYVPVLNILYLYSIIQQIHIWPMVCFENVFFLCIFPRAFEIVQKRAFIFIFIIIIKFKHPYNFFHLTYWN